MPRSIKTCKKVVARAHLALPLVAFILSGCATTAVVLPSPQQIEKARADGSLISLLEGLKLSAATNPEAKEMVASISKSIAQQKFDAAKAQLVNNSVDGVFPAAILDDLQEEINSIGQFDPTLADELVDFVVLQREKTKQYLQNASVKIANIDTGVDEQIKLLKSVSRLQGIDTYDRQQQVLSNAYNLAHNAEIQGDNIQAAERWEKLFKVAPSYKDTQQRKAQSEVVFKTKHFESLVADGDVDGAAQTLLATAAQGGDIAPMREGARQIIDFYSLEIDGALADGELQRAHGVALTLKKLSEAASLPTLSAASGSVLEELVLRAETLAAEDHHGLAMGLLLAAEELDSSGVHTADAKARLSEYLLDKSITRITLGAFESTSEYPQLGLRLSSLIKEKLVQSELDTIKLIERDKLQSVFVEKELLAMRGGDANTSVEPADIVIEGSVLAARIDESKQERRQRKRVVVSIEKTPTPEYTKWLGLPDSKRRKQAEPKQFIEKEITEDVTLSSIDIRKDGRLSASYRMINPISANIIKYQTLEEVVEYSGAMAEGVEIGLFVQASSSADIPSDNQILAELVGSISDTVTMQLFDMFADPITMFEKQAINLAEESKVSKSAEQLGKAYSFAANSNRFQEQVPALAKKLKDYSLLNNAFGEF